MASTRPPLRGWLASQLAARSVKARILSVAAAVLLPMLAALALLAYQVEELREATRAVHATHEAIRRGNRLLILFSQMKLAMHAYAMTGDDMFLETYRGARAQWPDAIHAAGLTVASSQAQATRLAEVERDGNDFFTNWEGRLANLRVGGDDQTAWMRMGEDITRLRRISATIDALVADAENTIRDRIADEDQARRGVYGAAAASSLAAVTLLAAFGIILGRSIASPIERVAAAARELGAGNLDERVLPVGGPETRALATAFNHMAETLQGAQASLAQRNRDLEQLSSRLKTANEDLADRQRETDDFLYVLSHDLRAPLINIQGFGRRLRGNMTALESRLGGPSPDVESTQLLARMEESLRFIHLGTSKIDQLIQRLLEIARVAINPGTRQWIDTEATVRDVYGSCRFQLEEHGIEASVGPLPSVYGDPVQLNQVFTNLVDNAIKYMGDGPRKRISVDCIAQGDRYCFAVRDTGPGIDPRHREKVFRLFTRLAPSTAQGEGIGLATVRAIINRHGGRIWVESAPDAGSVFYFTLPRTPESASPEDARTFGNGADTTTPTQETYEHVHSAID